MFSKYFALFIRLVGEVKSERPLLRPGFVFRRLFEIIAGRLSAALAGFGGSFFGSGVRIIGSKGISIERGAAIKRHGWIEAIHAYGGVAFTPEIRIGRRFISSERLHISAIHSVVIGDDCLFGSGVYIGDHNHGSYKGDDASDPLERPIARKLVSFGAVVIGSNVWFGDNVVVIGPATIGCGTVIGANSVVTGDVPDCVVAAGAPLKIIRKFNAESQAWERAKGIDDATRQLPQGQFIPTGKMTE